MRRLPDARHRPVRRTLTVAGAGLLVTLLTSAVPAVRFAYRSPDGRLVLETVSALIAALVALLFVGRFLRTRSRQALLLVCTMALLALAGFGLVVLPAVAGAGPGGAATSWAPVMVRGTAALLLLAAAVLPDRRVPPGTLSVRHGAAALLLLAVLSAVVEVLVVRLPTAVTAQAPPEASGSVSLDAHPVLLLLNGTAAACFAAAAVSFTRQASRTDDELAGWIGAAAAVGAWARVNYLLYPSLYSGWLYTGDLLKLGFTLLLMLGCIRELQRYWQAQAESAAASERRRLARDLHDGALQELGFIRSRIRGVEGPVAEQLRSASERALDDIRAAVAASTAPVDDPLPSLLRRRIGEVAERLGVEVRWVLVDGDVPDEQREHLVRISREAVSNAARHGRAHQVDVRLRAGELVIADDGLGFDTALPVRPGAFGLTSMRDRAQAIGGSLVVVSEPGVGTEVRVSWTPSR